ncbi:MAG: amino acid adenylation domain-containing protein [Chloroflexi bacterium]|nr:amino acid adenylation domain-containing protein [Chloroflexota bacterium]
MLFHSLYTPESGVYFEQFGWTVREPLNVPVFERAWQYVVDQHPILRTSFFWEDLDEPLQVVNRRVQLPIIELDWSDLSPEQQEAELEAYLQADRQRPFDLSQAPLMRVSFIRGGASTVHVVWSYHHLLLDGWSVPLVMQDVFTAYNALIEEQAPRLARRRSYRDYLTWLRKQDMGAAESYWRETLSGLRATTPLPIDRAPGSLAASYDDFAKMQILVSPEHTETLQTLARQERLTINTIVQGAWVLLLSHYSGEHDLVFGATVSGRPADLAGSETMVGCFINTLPVRVQVEPELQVRDWLQALQRQQADLRQYEFSPLVQVQSWSDVPRGEPLFESIVVFENYPSNVFGQSEELRVFQKTNYPLTLIAVPGPSLTLRIGYETHRFDAATIKRLLTQLETVLVSMADHLELRLADVDFLTDDERQRLIHDWNNTAVDYAQDVCLHQLVAEQVARTPEAIAVTFEGQSLSYAELDARANQLAHQLQALGVGPEVRVGICMERSLELVVGLLGILKAGGAYVPLDPGYPPDRLQFMLADSQTPVLLTQQAIAQVMAERFGPADQNSTFQVLTLDRDWSTIAGQPTTAPTTAVEAGNLAYMIYTSGSTGQPKGALNEHRGIVNRLLWMQDTYGLNATDRVLQKTPFSFDVSVWEFFWPLLTGATLVVAKPGGHQDPAYLVDLIARERITTLHFVPSMLRIFLDEPSLDRISTLKRVICSGEALPYDLQERFFARSNAELHNLYGPTEAAVDVSFWACQRDSREHSVPIGRPVANTQLYILDDLLNPQPVGAPGELHIGGVQVGRGYLNRPALTSEKFIPDPFSQSPKARLYTTSDLARFREDGAIEYLSRIDFQVKIRGNRVELGEIEAALVEHPAVHEVVVLAREDEPGDMRLVAYVVGEQKNKETNEQSTASPSPVATDAEAGGGSGKGDAGGEGLNPADLRAFLQPQLPSYMLPSAFVVLEALPLSPNGKLDRKALPKPEQGASQQRVYVAPRTELEKSIAEIWASVLHVEQVGLEDNFFDLGGHSLLAMQVHSKLREHIGRDISMLDLFKYTTVGALARFLSQAEPETSAIEQIEERAEKIEEGKNRRKQRLEKRQRT